MLYSFIGPISEKSKGRSVRLAKEQIQDLGDGRYTCQFVPMYMGLYTISVFLFGKESALSGFSFMMKPTGGVWLQQDGGSVKAVRSDVMSANADATLSRKERQKRLKQAKKFTRQATKRELEEIMQQTETSALVQEEMVDIMSKHKSMLVNLQKMSHLDKTEDMLNQEIELVKNHDSIILNAFLRTLNHPGHILMKYPNSKWAKPHTRRVCIKGLENGLGKAIFMWTADKYAELSKINHVKAGKGDVTRSPWKFCDEPDNLCFELKIKNKVLAFKCANHYGMLGYHDFRHLFFPKLVQLYIYAF